MAKKIFKAVTDLWNNLTTGDRDVAKEVKYSLSKYKDAYKWLEQYDNQNGKNPETLAKPQALRPYLQKFSGKNRVRRTHPAV